MERNNRRFKNKTPADWIVAGPIILTMKSYIQSCVKDIQHSTVAVSIIQGLEIPLHPRQRQVHFASCIPPVDGEMKVKSDGALSDIHGDFDGVVRDSRGEIIRCYLEPSN